MVLLDTKRGRYHTLNQVGARVWQLLASGMTSQAIVSAIDDEFELPPDLPVDQIARDTDRLLRQLSEAGLITEMTSDAH